VAGVSSAAPPQDDQVDSEALGLKSALFERLLAHVNKSSVQIEEEAVAARMHAMARDQVGYALMCFIIGFIY